MNTNDIDELMAVLADNDSAARARFQARTAAPLPVAPMYPAGKHAAKGIQYLGVIEGGRYDGMAVITGVSV